MIGEAAPPIVAPEAIRLGRECLGQQDATLDLWRVGLDVPEDARESAGTFVSLARILSPDERDRARRFRCPRDRRRFVVGRARLRQVLATYLDVPPAAIRFAYGPHGKPHLADPWRRSGVSFNLSHSGQLALIAVARGREVGVDVEQVRPVREARQIADRWFSPRERRALWRLPDSAFQAAFYGVWTRKEACLKAAGTGLSRPLDQIDVGLAGWRPVRVSFPSGDRTAECEWSVWSVVPATAYVAAVAVEGGCAATR